MRSKKLNKKILSERDKFFLKHGLKYCIFISLSIFLLTLLFSWLVGLLGVESSGILFIIFFIINSSVLGILLYKALREVIVFHKDYNLYLYSLGVLGGVIIINMIILSVINGKFTLPSVGIPAIVIFLIVPVLIKRKK